MNAQTLHRFVLALAWSIALLVVPGANAGLFRAYLSANGSDANPCTLQQPCRLLPAALVAINNGGEIWMLDSANYNTAPVNINKSVTILAIPGALGSVVANGGDAIDIAGANVFVTLRNLVVLRFAGGGHGINFSQGTSLVVEGCEMYGLSLDGIHMTAAPAALVVKNTTIRNGMGAGVFVSGSGASPISATLDHVALLELGTGFAATSSTGATIAASLIANTVVGVALAESGGSGTRATVDNSVIRSSGTGIRLTSPTAPDTVRVTVGRTLLTNNATGIDVQSIAGDAKATIENDVIQHHQTAININGGVVLTRGNNTMSFFTNGVVGGALTPLGGV